MTSVMPPSIHSSRTQIIASPQASPILCQMEYTSVLVCYLWFPDGVSYLAKGCRPDFNNSLGGDSNSDPILAPQHLLESDLNNGPSPSHSNLVSDGVSMHLFRSPAYGFLVCAIPGQGL